MSHAFPRLMAPALFASLGLLLSQPAHADPSFKVKPWTFVGTVANCGVAGSEIVGSDWVKDIGLPDDKGKDNQALILSKNGVTADCSAAGASIDHPDLKPKKGLVVTELGFDIRNGGNCGAGAPRFNLTTEDGNSYFSGCSSPGTSTPGVPQAGWNRVRMFGGFSATTGLPVNFPLGSKVVRIDIVFDEGVDTGPSFSGMAIIDNIDINGELAGK